MRSSDFTHRIALLRATVSRDAMNDEVETFRQFGVAMASVRWGTAAERIQAAQVGASQSATVTLRQSPNALALNVKDRICMIGAEWNIAAVSQPSRHVVALTVERI